MQTNLDMFRTPRTFGSRCVVFTSCVSRIIWSLMTFSSWSSILTSYVSMTTNVSLIQLGYWSPILTSYVSIIAWSSTTKFAGVSTMAFWVSRRLPSSWARLSVATPFNPYSNTCSNTYSPSCPPLPLNSLVVLWPSSSCKIM